MTTTEGLREQLQEVNRAVAQEVARAQAEGRKPYTGGLHWAAGQLAQELDRLEARERSG